MNEKFKLLISISYLENSAPQNDPVGPQQTTVYTTGSMFWNRFRIIQNYKFITTST